MSLKPSQSTRCCTAPVQPSAAAAEPDAAGARAPAIAPGHCTWTRKAVRSRTSKKRLKEATVIIKARDETIAGLQRELDDLRKQLPEAKLKAAELEGDLRKTKGGKPGLELQDALQQLPPEIHHKMLPASRICQQDSRRCGRQ